MTHSISKIAATLILGLPTLAMAQTTGMKLELNSATSTPAPACTLTFLANNGTDEALQAASYEVAVFDADAVVTQLLVLEFGSFPPQKTKVAQFTLAGTNCENISRILVNSVAACTGEDGAASKACELNLVTRTRFPGIDFGL